MTAVFYELSSHQEQIVKNHFSKFRIAIMSKSRRKSQSKKCYHRRMMWMAKIRLCWRASR
jgi:hypothetical protein